MIEHLSTVTELSVDAIIIEDRLRDVNTATLDGLKQSIEQSGLLQNITVRRKRDGDYLLDGMHRLTAMREIGRQSIPVRLVRCNDAEARLIEIDANLAGAPLIPVDLAMFLAERKRAYEALHPEAKAATGADLVSKRWDTAELSSVVSFVASVQEQLDLSERHIRNYVRAGSLLERPEIESLRKAPKQVGVYDLIDIGKIGEHDEREFVVKALVSGQAKKVSAARKAYRAARGEAPAPVSDRDQKLSRLLDAWDRAGKRERRAFLEERGAEVAALLGELDQGDAE
ncbi:ParB-like nuclease domain protein [Roseovarius sp. TM1035]|jgi:ParB family chromosome partitioning protein|uniref:ParB/RepB/Spo0J family partition protein n=1 Tax=Roseovarius sp. TM1035 TaxID=391613 RepID=UPI0001556C0F|nr:ParB/RepB/Spo0J family partition protein [Roseovarius sp. TM1035]AWZ21108.1 ParB-like nuclease domain protein [Roseovarius sp. AK1035]EDM32989.1 ParB-like nuclease domain protein [Roseovarius sp. TM1035]